MKMRFLMVIFLLFCYACVTSGKGNVTFVSKNFYNNLTWDPADPRVPGETVRYSVFYGVIDDEGLLKKAEHCQNIIELFCDLTAETPADHDDYYKAKVFANGSPHGTTRNFKPIAETVLGAPTLSVNTSRTSFHMNITLPFGPSNESFKAIFSRNHKGPSKAVAVYRLFITEPLWAAQTIENTTGQFDVSVRGQTKYCGYVVYTPVHEHGRPLSEKATFCVMVQGEENPNLLMVLPWLLLSVVVVAAAVSMAVCFAKRYVKDVKNYKLPQSLISTINPPQAILYPQKDQNIFKPEMSTGSESEETQYAKIQWKPNASSADDGAYGHKNTIFVPWNEDSSLDTIGPHSPGLHYQDDSAQFSEIYGAVAVSVVNVEENEDFHQRELNQTDRNNTPLMSSGNGSVKSGQLLSTPKTIPLSTVDIFDNSEAHPLVLQTQKNSEGQLILPMLPFQVSQPFTGTTEELERKPLLSYLIVSSDKGENFVSLHSLGSSECSDSGVDENTLPSPTQDYGNSQYLPTQLDLTHFSPSSQSPLSCDSGTHDSAYKENWMPSVIQETNYHWTWSGLKEEGKEDD